MSNKINILSQDLINQIAAGEVVERPASVVKELVENSLDAGAKNITIEIENGGINLVQVSDDGSGMSAEDARLSIVQHATSKIGNLNDLFNIGTLGFRGEALASISSVSHFQLITRRVQDQAGTELTFDEQQMSIASIGCPIGTTVKVKNLFYNVPARQKYLKTAVTEFNHIVDLFINYALAFPKVGWKFLHNGRMVYHFPPVTDSQIRIMEVLGKEIATQLIPCNINAVEMKLDGFIGRPQIARNNRRLQFLFVNGRPVNEFIIAKRIKDAYDTLLPNNLFPVYILNLIVDPQKVDVNVHPRKLEVRFSDPQKIYQFVYRQVADLLDRNELVKNIQSPNLNWGSQSGRQSFEPTNFVNQPLEFNYSAKNSYSPNSFSTMPKNNFSNLLSSNENSSDDNQLRNYRVIGQVNNSYITVETKEGLRIYDQHATSERVQYEKIKKQWLEKNIMRQSLLLPQNIDLSVAEANMVRDKIDFLAQFGFELSEFSNNSFVINAVPQIISQKKYVEDLQEIISDLMEYSDINDGVATEIPAVVNRVLNRMSCRSAIMFGDALTIEQMYELIDSLLLAPDKYKYTCVHGRPCVIEYTFGELERLFKRK